MSECYCDYEPAVFYFVERRKARKLHTCDECGHPIRPGEQYEHVRAKWDDINSFDTCSRCLALREYIAALVPCFCWGHGNMIEDAINTAEEYHDPGSGLLFGALRRKILIEREGK